MVMPNKRLMHVAPSLESERVLLRPFVLNDAREVSKMKWNESGVKIDSIKKAEEFLKYILEEKKDGYYLGVFLKKDNVLIGKMEFCHLDWYGDTAGELCYSFDKKYWGKGYATEVSKCFVDYLFRKVKVHKVYSDTDPDNFASQNVLFKLGFNLEGVSKERNWFPKEKAWVDEYNWGLLRDDWLKVSKKVLFKML